MVTKCKNCSTKYTEVKAAYVFPQTNGLCWGCHDAKEQKKHIAKMTPAKRKVHNARWNAINAITQEEINMHCQFDGLPLVSKVKK